MRRDHFKDMSVGQDQAGGYGKAGTDLSVAEGGQANAADRSGDAFDARQACLGPAAPGPFQHVIWVERVEIDGAVLHEQDRATAVHGADRLQAEPLV